MQAAHYFVTAYGFREVAAAACFGNGRQEFAELQQREGLGPAQVPDLQCVADPGEVVRDAFAWLLGLQEFAQLRLVQ